MNYELSFGALGLLCLDENIAPVLKTGNHPVALISACPKQRPKAPRSKTIEFPKDGRLGTTSLGGRDYRIDRVEAQQANTKQNPSANSC